MKTSEIYYEVPAGSVWKQLSALDRQNAMVQFICAYMHAFL